MENTEIDSRLLDELRAVPKRVLNPAARRYQEEKYERQDYDLVAPNENLRFRIYLRQNLRHSADFSCGIRWLRPDGSSLTLARYNGASHRHGRIAYHCHIHVATEEAIRKGQRPESQATGTDRYATLEGAFACLLSDFSVLAFEPVR